MMTHHTYSDMKTHTIRILIIAIALTLGSCSSGKSDATEQASEETSEIDYTLTEKQFQSSQMTLGSLETRVFHEVVKANGMFDVPPESHASVSSYFGGTVKNIKLLSGDEVKKGQTLFVLENPDFVQLQQEYLEAHSQLSYLKTDYERQTNLVKDSVTSQKNFLKAVSDYTVTKIKVASLHKKLLLMNINPTQLTLENIQSTIAIPAPIDGFVTKINVTRGTFLSPSETAISLVNTTHLHVELNIFEKDLANVQIGQKIQFKIQEEVSNVYNATVHLINKTIDPESRTIGLHGHLLEEQLNHRFIPGMYLEALIYTSSESKTALPQNTVVEIEGKFYVLVLESFENAAYSFRKKEVKTGASLHGYIEILNASDFKKEDRLLTKGSFDLITE